MYKKLTEDLVSWIKDYFEKTAPSAKAVVGISGGKDSSVVAAACVEALGKDRVVGVLMPQNVQSDIDCSRLLVSHLGITNYCVNVGETVAALTSACESEIGKLSADARINMPPRIRMATLYCVAQCVGGLVANTCNYSEDYVGYATKFGDGAGDFSPLSNLTVTQVKGIGRELGLPESLVEKPPIDGLCGMTDEEKLGFTYATLDKYIQTGVCDDPTTKARIDDLHRRNLHKLKPMPAFKPEQN